MASTDKTDYDVLIIGAGLSGIGAAHHLQSKCPSHKFAILEARGSMGGTWDLFKYPGIRSDSDMYTLGYSFKPWKDEKAIADGPSILKYIKETAADGDIEKLIKYDHKVTNASWSSTDACWTINCGERGSSFTCKFLFMCSGYYSYDQGHMPDFEGADKFGGVLVHPQKWTSDIDYTDKKVVVIGSGATAVTLVPEMAKKAAEVTMLQRSPSYVISTPQEDKIANGLRKILPSKVSYVITRWKNILLSITLYKVSRKWPAFMKGLIKKGVKEQLPEGYDVKKHFTPKYDPWDERLCMVPDNDLFESISSGKSKVVTDHIDRFTSDGILLKSGEELKADVVVSATGLKLQFFGGMGLEVDGEIVQPADMYCYRGMMFSQLPNVASAFGYTNASWTLKCDLTCEYVCRLLNHMKKKNLDVVVPVTPQGIEKEPLLDFTSGYVQRSITELPKQGGQKPWKLYQNYILDIFNFRYSSFKDDALKFS